MKKPKQLLLLIIFSVLIMNKSFGQTPGWLYTEDNKIKKSDGTIFMGRGVNVFDSRSCGAGVGFQDVDMVLDQIDEVVNVWGANFLRLCLESDVAGTYPNADPVTISESYQNELIAIAEHVEQMDSVYILFSLWWEPTIPKEVGWPTQECIPVWKKLTEILSPYSHVLFGICNEPTSNWNGVYDADVWEIMNAVADSIRKEEAKHTTEKHIIVAQGTWKYGRFVDYYVEHPITAGGGVNIAYETHPYDHPSDWNDIFLDAADDIPVIIGEFGPAIVGGDEYMSPEEAKELMELADEKKIPWAAWCYHSNCGTENSMLTKDKDDNLVINDWGLLVKNHLLHISQPKISDFTSSAYKIFDHVDTVLTFSAKVTGEDNKTIKTVTLDLTKIGGGSAVEMVRDGDQFTCNFTVNEGEVTTGVKEIKLTATDDEGVSKTAVIEITVSKLATSGLTIYNDNTTRITSISEYYGSISETQNSEPYEGVKHYAFNYNYTSNWAGIALILENRKGVDFSGYESIQIACKITGSSLPDVLLVDNEWSYSNKIKISEADNDYQVFTIPLDNFSGINLSKIFELQLLLGGQGSETGYLYFDDIRLIPYNNGTTPVTEILASPNQLTLSSSKGSEATFKIDSDIEWTASTEASWLSVSPGSGSGKATVTVNALSENTSETVRTANIVIQSDGLDDKIITVTQQGCDIATKVNTPDELKVKLFPNPVSNELKLTCSEPVFLTIMNIQGSILFTEKEVMSTQIDVSEFTKGVYFVKLESSSSVIVKSFIKK